jgi:hypothetical protein
VNRDFIIRSRSAKGSLAAFRSASSNMRVCAVRYHQTTKECLGCSVSHACIVDVAGAADALRPMSAERSGDEVILAQVLCSMCARYACILQQILKEEVHIGSIMNAVHRDREFDGIFSQDVSLSR